MSNIMTRQIVIDGELAIVHRLIFENKAHMRGAHFDKRALSMNLMISKMWLRRSLSNV